MLAAPLSLVVALASVSYEGGFWSHWGDGRAELAAYDLVIPRYGELRRGRAVAIFVTETFSESARVKADPGRHEKHDEVPVMKLNLNYEFQTGIYDYHTMTSAFVLLEPRGARAAGTPTKIAFSSQEWCGQVWQQLLFDDERVRSVAHSYFDGEADAVGTLANPAGGISEDVLLLWARGLAGHELRRGEKREVPLLPALYRARVAHEPLAWRRVTLESLPEKRRVTVPAGSFDVVVRRATSDDGRVRSYYVEDAYPHRVVMWEENDGTRAELRGVERLKYWELNREGDEAALRGLGLAAP